MNTTNYSAGDWLLICQVAVIWVYMASKAGYWLTGLFLRAVLGRTPKSRFNAAVSMILAEHPIQNNQTLTLTTTDQWKVIIYKKSDDGSNIKGASDDA